MTHNHTKLNRHLTRMTLTLDPVAADWTEEVGVQAVRFFNLIQEFSDIHHLQGHRGAKEYHLDTSLPCFHLFNLYRDVVHNPQSVAMNASKIVVNCTVI